MQTKKPYWWLFVKDAGDYGVDALIVSDKTLTGEMRWQLEREQGWTLIWDSAPSREAAQERAQDGSLVYDDGTPVYAFVRPCVLCGQHTDTSLVRATRYVDDGPFHMHAMPFNGYVCDQCGETADCLDRVVYVKTGRRGAAVR